MRIDFYAHRHYKEGKRQELWQLTVGRYTTGKGTTLTTKELEEMELKFNIQRINKKKD